MGLHFVAILLLFHFPFQHGVDVPAPKLLPLGVEVGSASLLLGVEVGSAFLLLGLVQPSQFCHSSNDLLLAIGEMREYFQEFFSHHVSRILLFT